MPSSTQLLQILLSLAGIISLLVAAMWCLRRFNLGCNNQSEALQLVTGLSLGSKEKVVLIKAGNEHVLLGVTPQSISRLGVVKYSHKHDDFSEKLESVITQRNS